MQQILGHDVSCPFCVFVDEQIEAIISSLASPPIASITDQYNDEVTKEDASTTTYTFSAPPPKKSYLCRRCHVPKKGHKCPWAIKLFKPVHYTRRQAISDKRTLWAMKQQF
jgi:hypothetical protein